MKQIFWVLVFVAFWLKLPAQEASPVTTMTLSTNNNWVLVVHGGAGGPPGGEERFSNEDEYRAGMKEALTIGSKILSSGGQAVDAVEAVVRYLEDNPLFNAGKGAVLNEEGQVELDASIMDGKTQKAGAVAAVSHIKNPVSAARLIMEKTEHLLLVDGGAEKFAKAAGLEMVDPSYFMTGKQQERFREKKPESPLDRTPMEKKEEGDKHGTVGAVALDQSGNLAAATSTGGMSKKMAGRVGDSPIIGAGTWAGNSCAVSCTGHGEYFMRTLAAYDVAALMEYRGLPLDEASRFVVYEKLKSMGGEGGMIAIDREGNIAMPFNTRAMIRGFVRSNGETDILFYP